MMYSLYDPQMPKTLSIDIRERILKAYDKGGVNRQEVADRFDVSLGMVKKLLCQRKLLGNVAPLDYRCGGKVKITVEYKERMKDLLLEKPDLTLEELKAKLEIDCTIQAIHYVLAGMGMSYKKRLSEPLNKTEKISVKSV